MEAATKLTDTYVSEGKALINDKFPVTPGAGVLAGLDAPGRHPVLGQGRTAGGRRQLQTRSNGFNLKLDPTKATDPAGQAAQAAQAAQPGGAGDRGRLGREPGQAGGQDQGQRQAAAVDHEGRRARSPTR